MKILEEQLKEVDSPTAIPDENAAAIETSNDTAKPDTTESVRQETQDHTKLDVKESEEASEGAKFPAGPDVEMTEAPVDKIDKDLKPNIQPLNGDISKVSNIKYSSQ